MPGLAQRDALGDEHFDFALALPLCLSAFASCA